MMNYKAMKCSLRITRCRTPQQSVTNLGDLRTQWKIYVVGPTGFSSFLGLDPKRWMKIPGSRLDPQNGLSREEDRYLVLTPRNCTKDSLQFVNQIMSLGHSSNSSFIWIGQFWRNLSQARKLNVLLKPLRQGV